MLSSSNRIEEGKISLNASLIYTTFLQKNKIDVSKLFDLPFAMASDGIPVAAMAETVA